MSAAEAMIIARLANGPLYVRSFQRVKPLLDRMIERGTLRRVAPLGSRARNMVELAPANDALPEIDRFAERLAAGHSVAAAGRLIDVSPSHASALFVRIKVDLGAQAA